MDYIFRDQDLDLSILITCKEKNNESQCILELECDGSILRERHGSISEIVDLAGEWSLNGELKSFIRKHVPDDTDTETLFSNISATLKEHTPLTKLELLTMIESAVFYPDTHHIDVTINGQVFTVKEADYQSSSHLKTWMMSQFKRILNISDEDWKHIVKHIRDISENGHTDPTAPPVLATLLDLIENNNVFSDFCDDFVSSLLSNGSQMSFMLQDDTLYVPTDIYDFLKKKFAMSYSTIRQYTEKYLENKKGSEVETVTVHGRKKSFRFWKFSFQKLWELRSTLSQKEVIPISAEDKEKLYEADK